MTPAVEKITCPHCGKAVVFVYANTPSAEGFGKVRPTDRQLSLVIHENP